MKQIYIDTSKEDFKEVTLTGNCCKKDEIHYIEVQTIGWTFKHKHYIKLKDLIVVENINKLGINK